MYKKRIANSEQNLFKFSEINTYKIRVMNFLANKLQWITSPFYDTNLMDDQNIFFVNLKNKLDDVGFNGTDLYDDFKIIKKRIQADFCTLPYNCFMQYNVTSLLM